MLVIIEGVKKNLDARVAIDLINRGIAIKFVEEVKDIEEVKEPKQRTRKKIQYD